MLYVDSMTHPSYMFTCAKKCGMEISVTKFSLSFGQKKPPLAAVCELCFKLLNEKQKDKLHQVWFKHNFKWKTAYILLG